MYFNIFTTLWANPADDTLVIFFKKKFPEHNIWHFMQIVSVGIADICM